MLTTTPPTVLVIVMVDVVAPAVRPVMTCCSGEAKLPNGITLWVAPVAMAGRIVVTGLNFRGSSQTRVMLKLNPPAKTLICVPDAPQ